MDALNDVMMARMGLEGTVQAIVGEKVVEVMTYIVPVVSVSVSVSVALGMASGPPLSNVLGDFPRLEEQRHHMRRMYTRCFLPSHLSRPQIRLMNIPVDADIVP